jgi:activator of HSP90 ATPase
MPVSRRAFFMAAGSVTAGLGIAGAGRSNAADSPAPPSAANLGISNSNGAIHQEVVFKASPARVYHVLTNARQFDKVVLLSGAITSMALKNSPAQIGADVGAPFSLFGGYITGRHIELSPDERIVQAWRSASWAAHIYSIARFDIAAHPEGARLVFDQTGFPNEEAVSLATGWRDHYWAPMSKVLA